MSIRVKAPGRVVLFGEHQDYLHLPVIPMAIDKYITIEGTEHSKFEMYFDTACQAFILLGLQ